MPTATLKVTYCLKCGARTRPVTDEDGETLLQCQICSRRFYKTAAEMGLKLPKEGEGSGCQGMTFKPQRSNMSPDSPSYANADSGCFTATQYLQRQSHCIACPFPSCKIDERQGLCVKAGRRMV